MKAALPTPAQIAAMTDRPALEALADDVQKAVEHIEARLQFSSGDPEWERSAQNALALHRFTLRKLSRRAAELRRGAERPLRPREANHPETNRLLRERTDFAAPAGATRGDIAQLLAALEAVYEAVEVDRADEIALSAGQRDEGFLAITAGALRRLRGQRHALTLQSAAIDRAAREAQKLADQTTREASSHRRFIDAARRLLDRETYLRVWAEADAAEVREAA